MANRMYPTWKELILGDHSSVGADRLIDGNIRLILHDTSDAYDAANQFVSDLQSTAIIARSTSLVGKTVTLGVFDASNVTFSSVTAGSTCNLVMYEDIAGQDTASPLVAYWDTGSNLPFATDGADVPVRWDDGTSRIFRLADA